MTGKRKRYSADFKAKVALEALRGELTAAQLAAKHGVNSDDDQRMEAPGGGRAGGGVLRQDGSKGGHPGRVVGEAARQDRAAGGGTGFFVEGVRSMSVERRRAMIDPAHPHLSVVRQCALVSIGRSTFYPGARTAC